MPTWLIERGFRFGIFVADCDEPPHVHVHGHGGEGKLWLSTLSVVYLRRYSRSQEATILRIVAANRNLFMERWDESCSDRTER